MFFFKQLRSVLYEVFITVREILNGLLRNPRITLIFTPALQLTFHLL